MEGPLLIPAPSWVIYGPQASLRGKKTVPIITKRENSYRLQADELDEACHSLGQEQKLLIINNPTNPTGSVYRDDEIRDLAEICRAYQVIVLSDEIYAMIDFTEKSQSSLAMHYPEGTIVTGGLSKSFAAGGYRLGIMMIPGDLRLVLDAMKSVISETFSAVSAPIQYAALEAYGNFEAVRPFIAKTCDIQRFASEYMYKRFVGMRLNCPRPEGSFYLFPDFEKYRESMKNKGILTGPRFCNEVLDRAHVAFLPGCDFYLPATNLGVRAAAVDYDGSEVLSFWQGPAQMTDGQTRKLFPHLVGGCDSLKHYLDNLYMN